MLISSASTAAPLTSMPDAISRRRSTRANHAVGLPADTSERRRHAANRNRAGDGQHRFAGTHFRPDQRCAAWRTRDAAIGNRQVLRVHVERDAGRRAGDGTGRHGRPSVGSPQD